VLLPNGRGKDVKIAFIAEGELAYQAEKAGADLVIDKEQLEAYGKNRAEAKEIANSFEANIFSPAAVT
jgi:large subunit ribosomal protein L1